MPFDATSGPALQRGSLNEIRIAAAASVADILGAISVRLRACGLEPERARWIGPVGQPVDLPPLTGYSPRTSREATWAMERALTTGEPVVVGWFLSTPVENSQRGGRRDHSDRLLRRLRVLAQARGVTAIVLRAAN